jgi:hypothetical protein
MRFYIDPAFRLAIRTHLLANLLVDNLDSPSILGVFGPPGEGKTFQIELICNELGLAQHILSPGELESENAGAPGQLLRRQYLLAGTDSSDGRAGVLVIHDIDTILGNWGDLVQYTVNRQVVYAQLMAFCDFPQQVAGQTCRRVPIILTGNNPSILYGPLLRPGRTRLFRWRPDPVTRAKMVARIFPTVDHAAIERLVEGHCDMPTSFWASVRSHLMERHLESYVAEMGEHEVSRMLSTRRRIRVREPLFTEVSIGRAASEIREMDVRGENHLVLSN